MDCDLNENDPAISLLTGFMDKKLAFGFEELEGKLNVNLQNALSDCGEQISSHLSDVSDQMEKSLEMMKNEIQHIQERMEQSVASMQKELNELRESLDKFVHRMQKQTKNELMEHFKGVVKTTSDQELAKPKTVEVTDESDAGSNSEDGEHDVQEDGEGDVNDISDIETELFGKSFGKKLKKQDSDDLEEKPKKRGRRAGSKNKTQRVADVRKENEKLKKLISKMKK